MSDDQANDHRLPAVQRHRPGGFLALCAAFALMASACATSSPSGVVTAPPGTSPVQNPTQVSSTATSLPAPTIATAPTATAAPATATATATARPTTATPRPAPAPATAQAPAGSVEVTVAEPAFQPPSSWKFVPATTTVKVGSTITWTNTGAVGHTATADDGAAFDSGNLQAKDAFSFVPSAPGTIPYHCTFHPWMKGTLAVVP